MKLPIIIFAAISLAPLGLFSNETEKPVPPTSTYPIQIAGFTNQLIIKVPSSFSRANSELDIKIRNAILNKLNSRENRKARYSEVFLQDWSSDEAIPQILVTSLGTLINNQGRISESEWQKLKEASRQSTASDRIHKFDDFIKKHNYTFKSESEKEVAINSLKKMAFSDESPNSFLAAIPVLSSKDDKGRSFYTIGKFIYAQNCIITVYISFDANKIESIENAYAIVNSISVE